ncbi:hypothetical protein V2J59_02435 [Pseudomonas alliivorans]|uniref:hypothetical protein n=1 Tax=Pseudomonas alliivorans TaxID=2810613 RepID=UPI001F1E3728|nr:hypothetical protein [Pseudomonas alliivorans]MEE4324552.1 hypothetical protein [Pseudomonas alliivorans]MEE4333407.1 hypothetical protein [Pseudomonas alliivorans]MEE4366082.1 hypothetical protein [Pseudomonas alliivorans]
MPTGSTAKDVRNKFEQALIIEREVFADACDRGNCHVSRSGESVRPKAVLFDLDNTLTNRALSIERYVKCFLKDFGLVVDGDSQKIVRLIGQVDNGGYLKAGSAFLYPPSNWAHFGS